MYLAIAEGAQRDFLEQLTRFANAKAFAIRIGRARPEEEKILVQMWREDAKMIVVNPFDPREYRISFYENGREPITADAVNSLVDDLKAVVSLVHGATFLPRD